MRSNRQCDAEEYARRQARWLLKDAVRYGKIMRGTACEFEGGECGGRIEAHHDDYSKPYAVRWVCKTHHAMLPSPKQIARMRGEGSTSIRNRKAIDMFRPNPRYDRIA